MTFFLGIDGGGSKTSCLLGDETSVLGSGTGSGSNVVRVGEASARKSLSEAIYQACSAANISPSQISRTCVGVAGGARKDVDEIVRAIVSKIVGGEIEVVGDMVIALQAAFGDGPGVIVIAGTGSIAYGRNSNGETARAGGWGFAISDEGSGHWVGRAAIQAIMRAYDEGKQTRLLASILNAWQLETRDQLILSVNAIPSPDFSALFPMIISAAASDDALAKQILADAGDKLSGLAKIVVRRLFHPGQAVKIAMVGGVFANSGIVREAFWKSLTVEYSNSDVDPRVVEPVRGALELARKRKA
ncbi:MAG TPA: BadF/BadG/BcrA/BcrD ATPase family protein [Terriglobales bacterium]|nr:BadF/BadG/BcrA/BcrD ATPase family protein [Terriglobales bacterium]